MLAGILRTGLIGPDPRQWLLLLVLLSNYWLLFIWSWCRFGLKSRNWGRAMGRGWGGVRGGRMTMRGLLNLAVALEKGAVAMGLRRWFCSVTDLGRFGPPCFSPFSTLLTFFDLLLLLFFLA